MSTTPHTGSDQQVKQEFERTKSEASELASSAVDAARHRGREAVDQAKERTAERAEEFASALDATADDLESADGGNETLSGYGHSMAAMMRRFAGGLREHEIEEFAGQLAGYARRNPASFLAGSVALGFGVSRFLKATSQPRRDEYAYDEDDEYLFEAEAEDFDDTLESDSEAGSMSTYGGTWPEDRGNERPGAGSVTEHWSPAVTPEPPSGNTSASSGSNLSGDASGTGDPKRVTETRTESVKTRSEEIRRNEP